MLKLRVVQADFGDCFILEYGAAARPRCMLIDGGPGGIYQNHLRGELAKIGRLGHPLDLVVLSHVDGDHVSGLLDLFADLLQQQAANAPPIIAVKGLWHNAFEKSIDADNTIAPRLRNLLVMAGAAAQTMTRASIALQGCGEGRQLRVRAGQLQVPVNQGFPDDLVCVDAAPAAIKFGSLSVRVVGPVKANLEALRREWIKWLDKHEGHIDDATPLPARMADKGVPDLGGICMLVESDSRRILLTGDARGDHIVDGLERAGLLDAEGRIRVDVCKVPRHGSDRNSSRAFFESVVADQYVISANGKDGHPDLPTLVWIVEAAKEDGRAIVIHATNTTPSTKKLLAQHPPEEYGYELKIMPIHDSSMVIDLA